MLNQFIFKSWHGSETTISAYDIFDAEKQILQIMRVCDFKGDFDKALKCYKVSGGINAIKEVQTIYS
jgi:hypothetical protein